MIKIVKVRGVEETIYADVVSFTRVENIVKIETDSGEVIILNMDNIAYISYR